MTKPLRPAYSLPAAVSTTPPRIAKPKPKDPVFYRSPQYTNRHVSGVLPQGCWSGRPAVIVGGGPSLKGFDLGQLRGWRTIGINRAFEFMDPTVIFSMDTRYLRWVKGGQYGEKASAKFDVSRAYKVWLLTYVASLPEDIFILPVSKDNYQAGLRAFAWDYGNGAGHGNNSGYGALQFACILGANPIYLLGFDFYHDGQATHWHDGHPLRQQQNQLDRMVLFFTRAAPAIKARGVRVVNLNPASKLRCFEFGNPEEVFK